MKYLFQFLLSIFLLLPLWGQAQHEASTWYLGNGFGLNFNKGAAAVFRGGPLSNLPTYTYTDPAGNLLFYANINGIFNKQGNLMQNGAWSSGRVFHEIFIIPKPGSGTLFYLFYIHYTDPSKAVFDNQAVMYAIVDVAAAGGAGRVIEQNKVIYKGMHGSFTISGRCENDVYWLVGEVDSNRDIGTDQFLAYKITAEGIASEPVRSAPANSGNSSWLKFSPKGDKIVFSYRGNAPDEGLGLANFNTETGKVSKAIRLEEPGWKTAFSASGNKLYLNGMHPERPGEVWQFDLSSNDEQLILASKKLVYSGPSKLYHSQLAPDGKIYFTQVEHQFALATIEYPELDGAACEVKTEAIVLPDRIIGGLPTFTTNYLYDLPVKADAGADREACQGQQVRLGGISHSGYTYRWEPALYLDDPTSPNPMFRYTGAADNKQVLTYTLTVSDGACSRVDQVGITVLPPTRSLAITGSNLICPGLTAVDYSIKAEDGYTYQWTINGGKIESGQGTASIKVNWGVANEDALVKVKAINASGCESRYGELPVRINVELVPEKPIGLVNVCLSESAGISYTASAANTVGATYTWGIKGGIIVSGQGTAQVKVDWQGAGRHKLWLMMQMTTASATCSGVSDTLFVHVAANQASINLDFVTIASEDGQTSAQHWQVNGIATSASEIAVFRRTYGSDTWSKVATMPIDARSYTDKGLTGADEVYEYMVATSNECGEVLESTPHRTVRLQGNQHTGQGAVSLRWNAYDGWSHGVASYEIWAKFDNKEYQLLHKLDGKTLHFNDLNGKLGFQHHYRIKAIAAGNQWESWSNQVSFNFEHALDIPNVFTPNGDGFNDAFAIPALEMYSDNELVIVNRLGKEVYRRKGYQGTWNGDNVPAGTYYYSLYIKKLDRHFKGWVEIVK